MCAWQNIPGDDFDWLRNQGSTTDSGTGPNVDHTTNTVDGFYVYTESSYPQGSGDEAFLFLGVPDLTGLHCLQFWYHMIGNGMGELLVYTSNSTILVVTGNDLWRMVGSQSPSSYEWLYGQVTIDFDYASQIYFVGIVGSSKSDMALDDIFIDSGGCEIQPPLADPSVGLQPLSCDFDDNSLCSWTQDRTDDFNWILNKGQTSSSTSGPDTDYSGTGYYIYLEATSQTEGQVTRLQSPTMVPSGEGIFCLQFYYHMYGSGMGTLNVILVGGGGSTEILFSKGGTDMGNVWNEAFVNVVSNDVEFHLVFEGIRGSSDSGDLAVDVITITDGLCPPTRTCDFELGFCGWLQEPSTDDFDWSRDAGVDVPHGNDKFIDHTTGSDTGHFIYADQSLGAAGQRALLYSGALDATPVGDCMTFWYHLASTDRTVGSIRVWELINGELVGPYWESGTGVQPSFWMQAKVNVKASTTFEVVLEAQLSDSTNQWLAVDDVIIDSEPCQHQGLCDFEENDYCYWSNTKNGDKYDWELNRGTTGSQETGPSKDHTTGTENGRYVYIDATDFRQADDNARLESATLPAEDSCFRFWYHMYGKGMGSLNVYTRDQINQLMVLEWSESGNHGDRWLEGVVSLSSMNSYNIIMEATFGGNYTGDVALDDTFITQTGLCNDTGVIGCDFEDDICGYTQEDDDDFDWTRHKGHTGTSDTGPPFDHTTGTVDGYYMYIETSGQSDFNKARISTPMVQPAASQCVLFWYHMYGLSIDTLNVYTRRNDGQSQLRPVWTMHQQQSFDWLLGSIQLHEPIEYQVVFEGVVGQLYFGDIALDDISMYDGQCPATSICEFETPSICGYRNDKSDDFDWIRWSGSTPTDNTGPEYDMTPNAQNGHYMYIEADPPQKEGDLALLIGPHMSHDTDTTSCWSFYYNMYGKDTGSLEVLLNENSGTTTILSVLEGDQGMFWLRESIEVHSNGYEIIFKGIVGNGIEGDIAIDSVDAVQKSCLSCDFELSLCDWGNVEDSDFNWIRWRGETNTPGTGPDTDHTKRTQDGFYVYMNSAEPREEGQVAKLRKTFIPSTEAEDMCFTFWYSMVGLDMGTLELYKEELEGDSEGVIWRLSGQQSSSGWLKATVPYSRAATFEFRGIVGNGSRSDIGLDDLNPVSGRCSVTPAEARVGVPVTPSLPPTSDNPTSDNPTTRRRTEQIKTTLPPTEVMRTEEPQGAEALAITLGVIGGVVGVILIVIASWFITKRRSSSKLEIAALQNHMENPAYDPDGIGGDIVLRDMEKKPVDIEPRYQSFAPVVNPDEGFENPMYASMRSPDQSII
ncbi:MAM and LDL-receptor class A domain-containing protein 1-like [Lytechinus variegatus]|uniref:MAM and LDL-receptor class A domain-containing protein 1-like n=1 Tax=Lytechinus variegatus TaxID=7654 RepID=UPI001BB22339|nr:MAM and LDL-receptor class A domain-containing protein 1-like [Lytechinus variegatus]